MSGSSHGSLRAAWTGPAQVASSGFGVRCNSGRRNESASLLRLCSVEYSVGTSSAAIVDGSVDPTTKPVGPTALDGIAV